MQCDACWTGFFEVLQQILPMNTNMKTSDHVCKPNWIQIRPSINDLKIKCLGYGQNSGNTFAVHFFWVSLVRMMCVYFIFLFVSFYECQKLVTIINSLEIFQLGRYLPLGQCATDATVVQKPQTIYSHHCSQIFPYLVTQLQYVTTNLTF